MTTKKKPIFFCDFNFYCKFETGLVVKYKFSLES